MKSYLLPGLFLGLVFCINLKAEISIDGVLDEKEWETARKIDTFYEVFPYSLKEISDFKTDILIFENPNGIYIGFKNYQSNESMRAQNHERDDEMSLADKNGVSIDFDADGLIAYQFFVSSGGSIGDATYTNETEKSNDWDGDWLSATTIGEDVWFTEFFIPWSIAPMKKQLGDKRKVKIGFYRMLAGYSRVIATIKGSPYQNIYMSAFDDLEFDNYSTSKIDFFPYLTLNDNRLENDLDHKSGAEIFWKIDSSKQLNVAINPDFGQVESDDIVVNFSATETFYSDKRPFFSENQSLFNVRGSMFRIINTRRIGASPDYECSQFEGSEKTYCNENQKSSNDIDAAVRYTQQLENIDIGFLGAFEANEKFSQGKDFYALRLRTKKNNLSIGYLGTYVEQPVFGESATVHSIDLEYRPSSLHRLTNNLIMTDSGQKKGYGFSLGYGYDPDQTLHSGLSINYFDESFDINDMGYQPRNNFFMIGGRTQFKSTDFKADSLHRSRVYEIGYGIKANSSLDREPINLAFKLENSFRNTSEIKGEVFYRSSGRDHRITRNSALSPYIKMPKGHGLELEYVGPFDEFLTYKFEIDRKKGGEHSKALDWQTSYSGFVKISPRSNLALSLFHKRTDENNWLNWLQDNLLGTYQRKQRTTIFGIQWFQGTKHELRLKSQMVAFNASDPKAYLGNLNGDLIPDLQALNPITLSELAFQIRYRYEFMPLAYLYVVYTKGGRFIFDDEEDDLGKLYKAPWNDPQSENFTVKLRYRF